MKMIKIYLKELSLIFFLFISFSFQQNNYIRYYLNNTNELLLYGNNSDYLLCANVSNSKIGDIIHIVFNIQNTNYSKENINYFF